MPTYITTVTQRSQVTLPAEVRRLLGLGPRDRVAFRIEGGHVSVTSVEVTLASLVGSIEPFPGSDDRELDRYIDEANDLHAESVIAETAT